MIFSVLTPPASATVDIEQSPTATSPSMEMDELSPLLLPISQLPSVDNGALITDTRPTGGSNGALRQSLRSSDMAPIADTTSVFFIFIV
jgi:hypothetical protein